MVVVAGFSLSPLMSSSLAEGGERDNPHGWVAGFSLSPLMSTSFRLRVGRDNPHSGGGRFLAFSFIIFS